MADAGSQQILDLLNEESARLTKSYKRLTKAMKRSPKRDAGVPAPIAFAALSDLRSFFTTLSGQIDGVDTASPAKAEVLAALALFDQANAKLEEALTEGVSRDGSKLMRKARKLSKQARNDMKSARAGLE